MTPVMTPVKQKTGLVWLTKEVCSTSMTACIYTLFHMQWKKKCAITWGKCQHTRSQISSIASNEDVLFYWSMLLADADEEDAQTILKMVIELWTKIRSFAFASSWIELYKQTSRKTIQRLKALRRNVQDSSSATDWSILAFFRWHTCSNRSNVVQLIWVVQLGIFSPRQRSVRSPLYFFLSSFFLCTLNFLPNLKRKKVVPWTDVVQTFASFRGKHHMHTE